MSSHEQNRVKEFCESNATITPISPNDAMTRLKQTISPLGAVTAELSNALHCYLAEPVIARNDIPELDRASVDGFAIHCEDTHLGAVDLTISETATEITPGLSLPVITGDRLPEGVTAVVRLEDIIITDTQSIHVRQPVVRGSNIKKKGSTAQSGEKIIAAGKCLRSPHMGICAASGYSTVSIVKRPTVAIISYGNGLVEPSTNPANDKIRDFNTPIFHVSLTDLLFEVVDTQLIDESPKSIKTALQSAIKRADVIIVTGGMSTHLTGPVPQILTEMGGVVRYNGVNIKPGRRQLFGEIDGRLVFGLPGSPLGGLVGLHEFVIPALRLLSGCTPKECVPSIRMPLMRTVEVGGTREHRILVKLQNTKYGPGLIPFHFSSSYDIISASKADGVACIPVGRTSVAAGQYVEFRPWGNGNFSNFSSTIGDQYVGANG